MAKTVEDFIEKEWEDVKRQLLNALCPIRRALKDTSPYDFYIFLTQSEELSKDWIKVKSFIKDQIVQEMMEAYDLQLHGLDEWGAKKAKIKIESLQIMLKSFDIDASVIEDKTIKIVYDS